MSSSFVLSPGEGETFQIGPWKIVGRVLSSQSEGRFEMYDISTAVAGTIDYHVHDRMDETIAVVEGQIEFNVAGTKYVRPAGSVAFIHHGVHHGFRSLGAAKVLVTFTPPTGQNEFFRLWEKALAVPKPDTAAIQALQKKYDQVLIPEGK